MRFETGKRPPEILQRLLDKIPSKDPRVLLASGALLVALDPSDVQKVRSALENEKIPCASIGRFLEPGKGMVVETRGTTHPLRPFVRDELARISDHS